MENMEIKYLLIGKKLTRFGRGSHVVSKRFCDEHECLDYIEGSNIYSLKKLNDKYKKIIIRCQVPTNYAFDTNPIELMKFNHLIFIRPSLNNPLYNSATNGFYTFLDNKSFKNYIPLISNISNTKTVEREIPCIGFYCRYGNIVSVKMYEKMIRNLKIKVDLYIMGSDGYNFKNFPMVRKCEHTLDNETFFSNITHYFYPEDRYFFDPFPHSLLEAVQTGKQIIIPDGYRYFRDGINDIQDFIQFHKDFDPEKYYDNSDCPLTSENFKKFYENLFLNDFEYSFDRGKYKTMIDWVANEVI